MDGYDIKCVDVVITYVGTAILQLLVVVSKDLVQSILNVWKEVLFHLVEVLLLCVTGQSTVVCGIWIFIREVWHCCTYVDEFLETVGLLFQSLLLW